ncbi:protein misato homolog 1-like [Argonauta hians]
MANTAREVITLQLGHYANYVGTHWWNSQEASFEYDPSKVTGPSEVNHDVLFREGKNLNGHVTFTPRLILWDLKGSLHSLKKEGVLYDFRTPRQREWHGNVTVKKKPKLEKNEFLRDFEKQEECYRVPSEYEDMELDSEENNSKTPEGSPKAEHSNQTEEEGDTMNKIYNLDDSTEVWSDFLSIHLHPKSVNIFNDFTHKSEDQPFDVYGCGYETMSSSDTWAEMEDRLHYFSEECDMLQGYQILVDAHNAFTGVAKSVLEYLNDEFSSKSLFTFGLTPTSFLDLEPSGQHVINAALCYSQLPLFSSLFVPLSLATTAWPSANLKNSPVFRKFSHVNYKAHLDYHTSALLAASLDTCTLPYRLRHKQNHMKDISHSFNSLGRKVAALCSAVPFPLTEDGSLVECLMQMGEEVPWVSLSPQVSTKVKPWMMSTTLRGIPESRTTADNISAEFAPLLSQCNTREDVLKLYLSETMSSTLNAGCSVTSPCHLATTFPHIFTPNITATGFLSTMLRPPLQAVTSVPTITSLQSCSQSGHMISQLYEEAKKVQLKRFHRFLSAGLEEEEFKDCLDELANLAENYSD